MLLTCIHISPLYSYCYIDHWIGLRENPQESRSISWYKPWFPVDFPINQSIDKRDDRLHKNHCFIYIYNIYPPLDLPFGYFTLPWKITILIGASSISMGHGFHSYVKIPPGKLT